MRAHLHRSKPIQIQYRNYKKFDHKKFLSELNKTQLITSDNDPNVMYKELVENFSRILDKYAPLKNKTIRGNNAAFMNKELRNALMKRSRLRNKFNKHKTDENWYNFKIQRNLCNKLNKKAKIKHFRALTNNPNAASKDFWNTIKPLITDKGHHSVEHV